MSIEQIELKQKAYLREKYRYGLLLIHLASKMLKISMTNLDHMESEGSKGKKDIHKLSVLLKDVLGERKPEYSEAQQIKEFLTQEIDKIENSKKRAVLLKDWYFDGLPTTETLPTEIIDLLSTKAA